MMKPSQRAELRKTGAGVSKSRVAGGQPALGDGPEGARFLGSVVVDVWEETETNKGVHLQWSGDKEVLKRAADELSSMARTL